MNAIEFQSVSKSYAIYARPADRLKELATFQRRRLHRDFLALDQVSFTVRRGEVLCVIGENGAGKSTLLQMIAGILAPSSGTAQVNGRVAALLELGSGFNPEYTGRDNVYLNGAILGFSAAELDARYPLIESFAEIGDFIDRPVKTYSSGMIVRLAFAVAIHTDPQILLVDEALSVGDAYFRQRCLRKVHEMQAAGVTIVFVSHSMADVTAIGDRTLWLEHGRARALGDTETIVARYVAEMADKDAHYAQASTAANGPNLIEGVPNIDSRHGDGRAEVIGIAILDQHGRPAGLLQAGTRSTVRISVRAKMDIAKPVVGFAVRNHLGVDFAGTHTARERIALPPLAAGEALTVDFVFEMPELYPAFFSFSAAVADGAFTPQAMCDWIDNAITVPMSGGENQIYGYMHLPCRVTLNAAHATEAAID